ncbi:MAG: indole-3-glycerol phosphate synthase TrpC [Acidobacteriota bacterium]
MSTILESTRVRVDIAQRATDVAELRSRARRARAAAQPHAFRTALGDVEQVNIIAEFKKASPSKGVIDDAADPAKTARSYETAGARAISVLTEPHYFHGSLNDLREVRRAVSLPILRKDFIVDEFQIYEAAEAGADAILLIISALGVEELRRFRSLAEDELGMDALIEVHTEDEMAIAASIDATLIGVNNRDLRSLDVSLDVSRKLVRLAPASALLVSESGITRREEIIELRDLGYSAFLIGETLMRRAGSIARAEVLL